MSVIKKINYNSKEYVVGIQTEATSLEAGLMSATDKKKLDGIAAGANYYSHPSGDGNNHVPANGTSNGGKYLRATSTAGTYEWAALPTASTSAAGIIKIGATQNDAAAGNHTHATRIEGTSAANQITLNYGDKYIITAGGTNYVFTMPSLGTVKGTAAEGNHTHDYLPLGGGTLTGALTLPSGTPTQNLHAATKQYVDQSFAANDAMIFKGTIGTTNATVSGLPNTHNIGWTYKVITPGTYGGVKCEIGDLIICIADGTAANNAHWTVAQTNIDGEVIGPTSATDGNFVLFNGTTGKLIKDSTYSPSSFVATSYTHTVTTPTGEATRTANVALDTTTVLSSVKSAGAAPTLGTAIAADDITAWTTNTPTSVTKKTVVISASGATASYSGGVLTITDGDFDTGDSVSVTAGTAASLSYTARSIPNVTAVGSMPTFNTVTVATGVKTQPEFTVKTQQTTLLHTAK